MIENNNIETAYALGNGRLVHIRDVDKKNKGNYICPYCGDEMIARKGELKAMNFAHKNYDCGHAKESILHKLAKEILEDNKKITLPELKVNVGEYGLKQLISIQEFNADNVETEKYFGDFRPDVYMENNEQSVAIEIMVTHPVDDEKKDKIKEKGLSLIEIDLRSLIDKEFTREDVKELVIEKTVNKEWLYHIDQEQLVNNKLDELKYIDEKKEQERIKHQKEFIERYNYNPATEFPKSPKGQLFGGLLVAAGIVYFNVKKSTRKKINRNISRFFANIFRSL